VRLPLAEFQKVVREAEGSESELACGSLHGVVEEHHAVGDGLVVARQVLNQLEVVEGAHEHRLVPGGIEETQVNKMKGEIHVEGVFNVIVITTCTIEGAREKKRDEETLYFGAVTNVNFHCMYLT